MNLSGIERQGNLMYQFNGMIEKEQAFGLELYETPFRGYDPQIGRFWQVEPLADIYVGINMYQFGYNNPISYNDPMGLEPKPHEAVYGPGGYTWDLGSTRGQGLAGAFRFVVNKIDVISYLVCKNSSSRKRTYSGARF